MVKILVGSENPVKIESVKEVFSHYFDDIEVIGVKVNSNVPDQPINDQTFDGAKNRAEELQKKNEQENINADFFVGIESGMMENYKKHFIFNSVCVINKKGKSGMGMSPHFEIPSDIAKELLAGAGLGKIADRVSGEDNIKQKQGIVGYLTKGKITRKSIIAQGIITALIPLLNEELYKE